MMTINLMPPARLMARARVRRVRLWTAFSILWACALAAGCAWLTFSWAPQGGDGVAARLAEAQRRLSSASTDFKRIREQAGSIQARLAVAKLIADNPDWSDLLAILSDLRSGDVVLESIDIARAAPAASATPAASAAPAPKPDKPDQAPKKLASKPRREAYDVKLAGVARTPAAAADFVMRLEQSGLFGAVRLVETRARDITGLPCAGFLIACSLADRPAAEAPAHPRPRASAPPSPARPGPPAPPRPHAQAPEGDAR